MEKIVVSVLGQDRPGIVASVSNILYAHGCNIEDLTQTILQAEFAAILLVDCPESCLDVLEKELVKALEPLDLSVFLRPAASTDGHGCKTCNPLVVTTSGPDCSGQVARVSEVINRAGGNITELKAVSHMDTDDATFIMIFEADFPVSSDQGAFRGDLGTTCRELGLDYSVQHREIFESINRI
ncbi:glycine cleavage system transcriptional repressor [Desulfoplanes sp.]